MLVGRAAFRGTVRPAEEVALSGTPSHCIPTPATVFAELVSRIESPSTRRVSTPCVTPPARITFRLDGARRSEQRSQVRACSPKRAEAGASSEKPSHQRSRSLRPSRQAPPPRDSSAQLPTQAQGETPEARLGLAPSAHVRQRGAALPLRRATYNQSSLLNTQGVSTSGATGLRPPR